METLEGRFKWRLHELGISQAAFARQIGLKPQNLTHWFNRGWVPGPKLFKVSKALGCDPRWLAHGLEPSAKGVRDVNEHLYADQESAEPVFDAPYRDLTEPSELFARYAALSLPERTVADLLLGLRNTDDTPKGVQGALDLAVELCSQTRKTTNPQAPEAASGVG